MGADSGTNQDLGISCSTENNFFALVQNGLDWVAIFLVHFSLSESSYKDWSSVPDNLNNLSRRKLRDVYFHIGVAVVSGPSIETANEANGEKSDEVEDSSEVDSGEGVDLSSSDVCFVFIIDSILVKPVVNGRSKVDVVSKVSGSSGGGKELSFFRHQVSPVHFFISPSIVLRNKPKASRKSYFKTSCTSGQRFSGQALTRKHHLLNQ